MIRTHELTDHIFDEINPYGQILQDICISYCTTTHVSPGQLVFVRDMLFNIPYTPDWDRIEERKKSLINKSNTSEDKSQVNNEYEVNDQILICREGIYRNLEGPFLGLYKTVQIYTNGGEFNRNEFTLYLESPYRS